MFAILPALISLRSVVIVGAVAFALGAYSGGRVVWKLWDVAEMRAENATHRENQRRLAEVLKVNDRLNTEDATAEQLNEEIYNAIITRTPAPVVVKNVDAKCDPNPVCVSASSMRDIKRLQ